MRREVKREGICKTIALKKTHSQYTETVQKWPEPRAFSKLLLAAPVVLLLNSGTTHRAGKSPEEIGLEILGASLRLLPALVSFTVMFVYSVFINSRFLFFSLSVELS